MKKKILLIPLALLLIASLVACAAPAPEPVPAPAPTATVTGPATTVTAPATTVTAPAPAPVEVFIIKLGHHHPMDSQVDRMVDLFAAEVKERSSGKMEVQVFPASVLGQEKEAIDGIAIGTLEMSVVSPGLMDKYWPVMGIESLPFVFDDWDHALRSLDGLAGEEINRGLLRNSKIRTLGFLHLGFRQMITRTKPITQLADMKGLKMRSPEAWVWITMFEYLGAKPTPVTWGEAYLALQTGVVEGMESPSQAIIDMKFYEATKYLSLTSHMFGTMVFVINDDFYNRMTADQQKVVREASKATLNYINTNETRPAGVSAIAELKELGMIVVEIEDREAFRQAVLPEWEEFYEKAPEGKYIMGFIDAAR